MNTVPFDIRSKSATDFLLSNRFYIDKIYENNLQSLEIIKSKFVVDPNDPEELQLLIKQSQAETEKLLKETFVMLTQSAWRFSIIISRLIYGDGATDSAIVALEKQRVAN
jgi:hypothetical protein